MAVGSFITIFCLVLTSSARRDTRYNVGKASCPCTEFCTDDIRVPFIDGTEGQLQSSLNPSEDKPEVCTTSKIYEPPTEDSPLLPQTVLCCSDCSCADDCWKTASCCPDKSKPIVEHAANCRTPVVKQLPHELPSNLGYYVIDECPPSEVNKTLVSKCTDSDYHHSEDLEWVFDVRHKLTFRNKYCALCHHVVHYVKWKMSVQCTKIPSMPELSSQFMLDDGCEIKLRIPDNVPNKYFPVCALADYNHCNETGEWTKYNADIERSCEMYHSPYFHEGATSTRIETESKIITYKNVFCFFCNIDNRFIAKPVEPVCSLSRDFGRRRERLTHLIDYGVLHSFEEHGDDSMSDCDIHEVEDTLTGQCRTLLCPFGSRPFKESCTPMFKQILKFPIDITYGLTVIWSSSDHFTTDDLQTRKALGSNIVRAVKADSRFLDSVCKRDRVSLYFVSNVISDEVSNVTRYEKSQSLTDVSKSAEIRASNVTFILQDLLLTTESCQLQNVIDQSAKPFLYPLTVNNWNGDHEMDLEVKIINRMDSNINEESLIFKECSDEILSPYLDIEFVHCLRPQSYSFRNETQCPKIGVKYSEISSYFTKHNTTMLGLMFTWNEIQTDEVVYTCIDDYYRWLDSVGVTLGNIHASSGESTLKNQLTGFLFICLTLYQTA